MAEAVIVEACRTHRPRKMIVGNSRLHVTKAAVGDFEEWCAAAASTRRRRTWLRRLRDPGGERPTNHPPVLAVDGQELQRCAYTVDAVRLRQAATIRSRP